MVKKRGFTLIELLVVIAIIGILSSVVLVSLNTSRAKARDAKRIADIDTIKTALALYADSNGSQYPDTLGGLDKSLVKAKLIADGPKGPNSGEFYSYVRSSDGLSYHLGATLEQSTNAVLSSKRACNSTATAPYCPRFTATIPSYAALTPTDANYYGGTAPFAGTASLVYDVTP